MLGLVKDEALTVDVNDLGRRIDAHPLGAHHCAVNADAPIGDHLFGRAPGRDPSLGKHLL